MNEPNVEEIVTYLSAKFNKIFYDREFISCVSNDFLKLKNKNNKCCVLVFPALGPVYQRALKYQAKAFDLATFGLTGSTFKIIAVCQKEYMLNENKQEIPEEKEMSSELLNSARDVTSRKKRPERQLYIPPAQRKLALNKEARYGDKNCSASGSIITNEAIKTEIEINAIESKRPTIEKNDREKNSCIKLHKCENLNHLESIKVNDVKKVNIDEFAARILTLHDIMHLNLLPLTRFSCNISYKIDHNSLSLKNFHECSCEFYKYLTSRCENELQYYIPIYRLSEVKFMQFLIDNYLCWQPLSTDNLINFDEIIENNCAIPFFNYIKNADDSDFLKSDSNNGLTLNQVKLFMKIKTSESEYSRIIVNSVSDTSEAETIFNEDLNICDLLRIICDNEPFENIVDLTNFAMGHYFRVPIVDGCEYFHVCDEIHDTQKCYMEVRQKITAGNASRTRQDIHDNIEFKPAESQIQSNIKNEEISGNDQKHLNDSEPKPKVITNPEVKTAKQSNDSKNKCKHEEEKEIMRKTKENINRKTRPIMKYSDDGDDLLKIDKQDVNNWEDLFDDNGQIQEELLSEIVHKVGKDMKIVKATEDYTPYMQKPTEDLEHVVEIYNFPPSLSTGDIIHAFSMFDSDSMYIVWVDDTHALLVLGSSSQAQRAMELKNPLIKVRPMSDASAGAMAMASQYDLKPAMKRPQTNLQTARRLITNHLGTKSQVTKEQTAKERENLRKAREQRKITKQNEKDAWEGNIRSSLR